MQINFKTPQTVAEIAAVYLSLTSVRDPVLKSSVSFWIDRYGDKPMADLSPDDVDAVLAELETVPNKYGKIKAGPTINLHWMTPAFDHDAPLLAPVHQQGSRQYDQQRVCAMGAAIRTGQQTLDLLRHQMTG